MTTAITVRATEALDVFLRRWNQAPALAKLGFLLAIPPGVWWISSFRGRLGRWKALGKGGLPHNVAGYMINIIMETFLSRDTRTVDVYDRPERYAPGWKEAPPKEQELAYKSFLPEPLPQRKGARARALRFAAPQRERFASEYAVPKIQETYLGAWDKLVRHNSETTEVRTSVLERQGPAIFLRPSITSPKLAGKTRSEVVHIHESDLSAHVVLSLADAKAVVANGWGERHQCSGSGILNLGYTMVYVPRTVEEVDQMAKIMQAGIDYMRSNESS